MWGLEEDITRPEPDIYALDPDIYALDPDISVLDQDISVLDQDICALDQDICSLDPDISVLDPDICSFHFGNDLMSPSDDHLSRFADSLTSSTGQVYFSSDSLAGYEVVRYFCIQRMFGSCARVPGYRPLKHYLQLLKKYFQVRKKF